MDMNKKAVINRLSSLKTPLMAVGVCQLGLFGSTVRGENTATSDIDILIDFNHFYFAHSHTFPPFLTTADR